MRTTLLAVLAASFLAAPALASRPQDIKEAIAALEQDVKEHPHNAELRAALGWSYKKAGRLDDSQAAFERAAQDDPTKAEAHYMLGLIYEKKGLKEKAQAAWQACLDNAADAGMKETARKHVHLLSVTK